MPSINALASMATMGIGGGLAGRMAWKRSASNPELDSEDRLAYTTSATGIGAAGALAFKSIGLKNISNLATTGNPIGLGRSLMFNPIRSLRKFPIGKKSLDFIGIGRGASAFKGMGGPIAAIAALAGGVGAIAYTARSNPSTMAYAESDYGETQYNQQSVKERMGLMGASGDMVFGLNNMRHG